MRQQFRAVAAAMGITYEMLTGDLTQVNYSSIRAGLLEFRRRCEVIQHGVIVHQLCRPIWRAWMDQAVLEGFAHDPRALPSPCVSTWRWWIPAGLAVGGPAEGVQRHELAIAGAASPAVRRRSRPMATTPRMSTGRSPPTTRADALGLVFDSGSTARPGTGRRAAPQTEQPTE